MIATFLLVFVTCGAGALNKNNPGVVSQLGQSVAGGLIVTVMIYAVGHISGAHMNPAVTLAFAVARHFPWIQVNHFLLTVLGTSTTKIKTFSDQKTAYVSLTCKLYTLYKMRTSRYT